MGATRRVAPARNRRFLTVLSIVLAGAASCCVGTGRMATAQSRLLLLTPAEADQLRLSAEDRVSRPLLRSLVSGPRIVVREPLVKNTPDGSVIETTPVTRFVISFEQNQAPIDMESLEIKARKGLLSVSLTPRLKPYVKGTSLRADPVSVPEGTFRVQIEIVDVAGSRTTESYRLEVRRLGSQVGRRLFAEEHDSAPAVSDVVVRRRD
jgi:hypothetical protein